MTNRTHQSRNPATFSIKNKIHVNLSHCMLQGQFFSGNNYRIYLLGNPIIWWGNLMFLAFFLLTYFYMAVRHQRGKLDARGAVHSRMLTSAAWLFVGWLLHYVPFWAMGRVLYFHHYFPAHLFSSMLTGRLRTSTL